MNLNDLEITGWTSSDEGRHWINAFSFDPFDEIDVMTHHDDLHIKPVKNLQDNQVSVGIADLNLDNFQDIVITYAIQGGLRVVALDGAALSLQHQTGKFEGGYFPDQNVLVDAIIKDKDLTDLSHVVLTSGFSSYAQSALEDLIITARTPRGGRIYTTQLQAGHFIATSELETDKTNSEKNNQTRNSNTSDQKFRPSYAGTAQPWTST